MFYQRDLLAYVQHYLSGGATTYHPLVGAIIITIVLLLVSTLTSSLCRRSLHFLPGVFHLPSCMLLGVLTDVHLTTAAVLMMGQSWVVAIVLVVLLALATLLFMDNLISYRHPLLGLMTNLSVLFVCMVLAVALGNTSALISP